MLVAHAFGNLVRGLLVDELSQQFVGIREGSGGTLACGDVTIDGHEVASIGGFRQSLFEARVAGGTFAVEDA